MSAVKSKESVTRISVSRPATLVQALDDLVDDGESRSAAVRRLVAAAADVHRLACERAEQERIDDEQWLRSYRELPQTDEELGFSDVQRLEELITTLSDERMAEVERPIHFAFALR